MELTGVKMTETIRDIGIGRAFSRSLPRDQSRLTRVDEKNFSLFNRTEIRRESRRVRNNVSLTASENIRLNIQPHENSVELQQE